MEKNYDNEPKLNRFGQVEMPQPILLINYYWEEVRDALYHSLHNCSNKKLEYFVEKQFPK